MENIKFQAITMVYSVKYTSGEQANELIKICQFDKERARK